MHDLNRRDFVKTTAALLGAAAIPTLPSIATAANPTAGKDVLRVLQVGVGGIGGMDRNAINRHPKAKIVGLCDVDQNPLDKVGKQFPDAFTETDYRKVFADRLDEFDAVNVCTPDHSHIAPMLLALANGPRSGASRPPPSGNTTPASAWASPVLASEVSGASSARPVAKARAAS